MQACMHAGVDALRRAELGISCGALSQLGWWRTRPTTSHHPPWRCSPHRWQAGVAEAKPEKGAAPLQSRGMVVGASTKKGGFGFNKTTIRCAACTADA